MIFLDLLFALYAVSEGFEQAWYPSINHNRAVIRRIAIGLLVVYSSCGVGNAWVLYINTGIALASIFLVFFTIAYNKSKGEDWNYIGNTAEWDKFMRRFPSAIVWSAYFIIMILAVVMQYFSAVYIVVPSSLINTTWLF